METILDSERYVKRAFWLLKLRWCAICLFIVSIVFASQYITSQKIPLYAISGIILVYNFLLSVLLPFIPHQKADIFHRIIILQITADEFLLSAITYYSGGVESPAFLFYILYAVLSSMLLSRFWSYFQATLAVFLFGLLLTLEYFQIIEHQSISNFLEEALYQNRNYIFAIFLVFSFTIYLVVYLTTSIVQQLRKQQTGYKLLNLKLSDKDRIKNEYLLSVSHDIKSHVAAIKSCLDILQTHTAGPLNEKQSNLVERADHRAFKAIAFLSTLLKLTQMRLTGDIEKECFSLKQCIYDTFAAIEEKAEKKALSIRYEINVEKDVVFGSPLLLEEAIRNMLLNAIKYTPENGDINLRFAETISDFIVEIIDTGIGIPPDEQDKIFDEFYRASNATKIHKEGTGLGLSIAKEVIQRHGGKIWAVPNESRGSTFCFTLPKCKDV